MQEFHTKLILVFQTLVSLVLLFKAVQQVTVHSVVVVHILLST